MSNRDTLEKRATVRVDAAGEEYVSVRLPNTEAVAKFDPEDWQRLRDRGVQSVWLNDNGNGRRYVRCRTSTSGKNPKMATRIMLGEAANRPGGRRVVVHVDGDATNCRRSNLYLRSRAEHLALLDAAIDTDKRA